ncbi:hypothetical protein ABFY27_10995 [Akkermansia massiliensis]
MNALCREHEISVYCLRRPPLENAYGLDLENIRFFHHEMNVYEKMRRSVMDRLVTRTPLFSSSAGARAYAFLRYTHSFKKRLTSHINRHQYDAVVFGSGFEDSLLLALLRPQLSPAPESSPGPTRPMKITSGSRGPISPVTSAMRSSCSTTASTKSSSCRTTTGGTLKRASTWQRGASTTRPASRRNGIPR